MMKVSSVFRQLVKKGVKLVNYADITLKDGTVLNLGPSDFTVGGFSMVDKTTDGKLGVGFAVGKTINMTIANHTNKFSPYDFYKAVIYLYVAIELSDGTVLKERKGKYYVVNPTSPGDTIKISGVDSMYLFDKPYQSKRAFPATIRTILSDCCTDCGVRIGFTDFENWNYIIESAPEDCTYREVISWCVQIAGYNARISNDDALELVWFDTSLFSADSVDGGNFILYEEAENYDGGDFSFNIGDVLDGGQFTDERAENVTKVSNLSVSTDDVIITGVKVVNYDATALAGTEEYVVSIINNPFTTSKESEIAEMLFSRLAGIKTRPMTCQIPNNPLWEPYDVCTVYDRKGNGYQTLINSVSYNISGFTTLSCKADDPVRNESSYTSEAARAIVQERKNTERKLSLYGNAVQNMNDLAANAMGLYRESEVQSDGSSIYYMSNRPIIKNDDGICEFELNSVVYKMTGDGFFVSEDGGISYTSGFDSEGNAIVNVLSAIGITFDWARGGTLSLGGFDNLNGVINIYDASGEQVGVFNNGGLAFYSNETDLQVIISPTMGIVQRDADGNEFYGLTYSSVEYLPALASSYVPDNSNDVTGQHTFVGYENKVVKSLEKHSHIDSDELNLVVVDSYPSSDYLSVFRKYRGTYSHLSATETSWNWIAIIAGSSTAPIYLEKKIQLPTAFAGKDWIVNITNVDIDKDLIKSTDFLVYWFWNNKIPLCHEGESYTTGYYEDYLGSIYDDPESEARWDIALMAVGHESPYIEQRASDLEGFKTVDYTYFTTSLDNFVYDLQYEIDKENAVLTIRGYAYLPVIYTEINISEFLKFRVSVVC